jgi:RimJ/RimL family protein N-acetyltransferase
MINLRKASAKDCRLIWKWANELEVRALSFASDAIPYDDHIKWFERKINSPDCYLYIAENSNDKPVGQIRFELEGNNATISISLDRKFRNKGYGSKMIALASQNIFENSKVNVIHAYIKKGNIVSASAFKKAGFIFIEDALIKGQHAVHLILEKKKS